MKMKMKMETGKGGRGRTDQARIGINNSAAGGRGLLWGYDFNVFINVHSLSLIACVDVYQVVFVSHSPLRALPRPSSSLILMCMICVRAWTYHMGGLCIYFAVYRWAFWHGGCGEWAGIEAVSGKRNGI